jgi:hypothetical protein
MAEVLTGTSIEQALRELRNPAAFPVFATADLHKAQLLAEVERMLRALETRTTGTDLNDLWSTGPFYGELYPIAHFRKIEAALAVTFGDNSCTTEGCPYCPGGKWALIGALLEVGLTSPSKTVLAEQRTLAVRLLVQSRGSQGLLPALGCLQISCDDVWTAVYRPPADPRTRVMGCERGTQGSSYWTKNPAISGVPPIRYFTQDFGKLHNHLAGRPRVVAPLSPRLNRSIPPT